MTLREPDRFDAQGAEIGRQIDGSPWPNIVAIIAAALRAAASSALERYDDALIDFMDKTRRDPTLRPSVKDACYLQLRAFRDHVRALIPPPAAPEKRDAPCGGCGHPLWWHQWDSKEHAFCCAPLDELQRDYCRCKNYQAPAAAPAAEPRLDSLAAESPAPATETGKAQGAEALTRCIAGQRETLHAAGKRIAELEALVAEANRQLAALAARVAPPEGEGT